MSKKPATTTTTTTTTSSKSKPTASQTTTLKKSKHNGLGADMKKKLRKIDWKELTPIGFEFNTWDDMKKESWTFPELNHELTEGVLSSDDHPLYVFMGAQPIVENRIALNIPYVVVVDCKSALPNKVCVASIQGGTEDILEMNKVGISWSPYVRSKYSTSNLKKTAPQVFTLNVQDRPGKSISMDRAQTLQYMLAYVRLPQIVEEMKLPEVTTVFFFKELKVEKSFAEKENKEGLARAEAEIEAKKKEAADNGKSYRGRTKPNFKPWKPNKDGVYTKKIEISFNKVIDRLKEYVPELIEDHHLDEDEEEVAQMIKDAFIKKREEVKKNYDAMLAEVAAYTPEQAEHFKNIKIYKFYPKHDKINVKQYSASVVNRFFGNATTTFPEPIKKDLKNLHLVADVEKFKKLIQKETAHLHNDNDNNNNGKDVEMTNKEEVPKVATKKMAGKRKEMETPNSDDEAATATEEPEEEEEEEKAEEIEKPKGKTNKKPPAKKAKGKANGKK